MAVARDSEPRLSERGEVDRLGVLQGLGVNRPVVRFATDTPPAFSLLSRALLAVEHSFRAGNISFCGGLYESDGFSLSSHFPDAGRAIAYSAGEPRARLL